MADAKGGGRGSGGSGGYGAFFGGLKEKATAATAQVAATGAAMAAKAQERIETAQGGKKMLDEGGPEVEARLLAKKTATDAVTLDRSVVSKLSDAVQIYKEAAEKMKASDDGKLASDYDKRAKDLQAVLDKLAEVPEAPPVSPIEQDAISILVAKGKYKWVA